MDARGKNHIGFLKYSKYRIFVKRGHEASFLTPLPFLLNLDTVEVIHKT